MCGISQLYSGFFFPFMGGKYYIHSVFHMADWLITLGFGPHRPDVPRPKLTGPLCRMKDHGSPVTLLKLQMAPKLILWISLGSKKKEPRYACLSEAKASHSQRMWAEVSSIWLKEWLWFVRCRVYTELLLKIIIIIIIIIIMKLCFWQLLVCLYEILVHNPKKMDIASFVPSDKKHLLCHVNRWLLSSTHTTSNLHLISQWLTVQIFHKCSCAVKHENMNFVFCFF